MPLRYSYRKVMDAIGKREEKKFVKKKEKEKRKRRKGKTIKIWW